ncbi:LPXTG cell wall anchor domain-containing protein [Streptococcus canis]
MEQPKAEPSKVKKSLPAAGEAGQAVLIFVGATLVFLSLLMLFRWKMRKA